MSVTIRPYRGTSDVFEVDMRFGWPDGTKFRRRFRAPVKTESQAQRWGEAKERELYAQGKPQPEQKEETQAKQVPTFAEFTPTYLGHARAERQKASTIAAKEHIMVDQLEPLLGPMKLDAIKVEDVQRVKEALCMHKAKTINNILAVLSHVFSVAIDLEKISNRPKIKRLKSEPPEPPFFEFDEYARLLDAAKKVDPRIHLAILLGGDAGLRRGEILALKWSDVDQRRRQLNVQRSVWKDIEDTTKGGKSRKLPMTNELAAAIAAHRHLRGAYVLCEEDGSRLAPGALQNWIELASKRAGLPETRSLHILRHTFCSHLAMRGAPVKAIQELAGHATLTMTLRYMHLSPSGRDAAIRLLDRKSGEGVEKQSTARA